MIKNFFIAFTFANLTNATWFEIQSSENAKLLEAYSKIPENHCSQKIGEKEYTIKWFFNKKGEFLEKQIVTLLAHNQHPALKNKENYIVILKKPNISIFQIYSYEKKMNEEEILERFEQMQHCDEIISQIKTNASYPPKRPKIRAAPLNPVDITHNIFDYIR